MPRRELQSFGIYLPCPNLSGPSHLYALVSACSTTHSAFLSSQNKPNQADDKRIRELQSDVSRLSKELDKLREDSSGIEAEIAELQDKIMKVGGARLRDQKAKVTGIRDQIDTLNDRITKTQVARSKAEKDLKKVTASIAKGEQELADIEAQLKALNGDIKEKMEAALEVRRKADQAQKVRPDSCADIGFVYNFCVHSTDLLFIYLFLL